MTDLAAIKKDCEESWSKAKITPSRLPAVLAVAKRLCSLSAKAIYQHISQAVWDTPDRWWFVAIVHEREASQNFSRSIAQGDRWDRRSVNVPRGIGPFKSFIDAAVFALNRCAPYAGKSKDWSIGGVLTLFIQYNGTGYEDWHHERSPYDWGATTVQQRGKYTGDAKYDPTAWDTQVGAAAMLKAMMQLDPTIKIEGA